MSVLDQPSTAQRRALTWLVAECALAAWLSSYPFVGPWMTGAICAAASVPISAALEILMPGVT